MNPSKSKRKRILNAVQMLHLHGDDYAALAAQVEEAVRSL